MRFIIAKHSDDAWGRIYSWRLSDTQKACPGDYAIVENKDGFAMVEVAALGETDEKHEKDVTNHSKGIYKNVLYIIPRQYLERARK